ncbi:ornithine carbamoyltransferase [Allohahella sp. A8]|uniref:ornithine carbamoyltransferase n=1 Tax=Allohahella sp. A8 TaxID=3141461 RepID=UPI000C0A8BA5|nr:ornithine carbamoyltransferase [Hahellaceae bacterium]
MTIRHFLTLQDFTPAELDYIIQRGIALKTKQANGEIFEPLRAKVLAMIFEKSSTRTRVSFESGMAQLGGQALFLSSRDTQLGRGEPVEDSARVLSRMVDIIMIRTFSHETIERFAEFSDVPVINALTDDYHPCQLLADMQTYYEHRGSIRGRTVAWIGDGNNMCNSYINAACSYDFKLRVACPKGYEPLEALCEAHADRIYITESPEDAVSGADLVATDVWASMGQEEEAKIRAAAFKPYQVSPELMRHAAPDALFMHCLPAHRGEEISETMLDHPSSVVWDEAENRLHAQKALMEFLLNGRVD